MLLSCNDDDNRKEVYPKTVKDIDVSGKIAYDEKSIPLFVDKEHNFEVNIVDLSLEQNNLTARQLTTPKGYKLYVAKLPYK